MKGSAMNVKRITPVLYANELEPCVQFWVERLGFEKTVEVPDGNRLGFVILQKESRNHVPELRQRRERCSCSGQGYQRWPHFSVRGGGQDRRCHRCNEGRKPCSAPAYNLLRRQGDWR